MIDGIEAKGGNGNALDGPADSQAPSRGIFVVQAARGAPAGQNWRRGRCSGPVQAHLWCTNQTFHARTGPPHLDSSAPGVQTFVVVSWSSSGDHFVIPGPYPLAGSSGNVAYWLAFQHLPMSRMRVIDIKLPGQGQSFCGVFLPGCNFHNPSTTIHIL